MCKHVQLFIFFAADVVTTNSSIDEDKELSELRQEPFSLPKGFVWDTLDINNSAVVSF